MAQVKVTITTDEGEILDIVKVEVSARQLNDLGLPNSEAAASIALMRLLNDSPYGVMDGD